MESAVHSKTDYFIYDLFYGFVNHEDKQRYILDDNVGQ